MRFMVILPIVAPIIETKVTFGVFFLELPSLHLHAAWPVRAMSHPFVVEAVLTAEGADPLLGVRIYFSPTVSGAEHLTSPYTTHPGGHPPYQRYRGHTFP
jgi:hypothetical protein